jgi:translation initiation factor IF-2
VGDITESDILLAKAANATIIGFSVSAPRSILSLAAQNGVPVSSGNIIYRIIDDVRSRVIDMLPKIIETKVTGEATVLQLFDITGKAKHIIKVAGCRVVNGLVEKQKLTRVIRNGHVIHEGSLDTMRQLKKEITEARKGTECGLTLKEFSDLQEGDLIQMYERIEKPGVI